ncbi:TldD/PmbA family protein [Candidatus Micrarchaeota archaeon]|nr:TldD/PmbA family protein [Candidatus Micrarchaeota archaeon]
MVNETFYLKESGSSLLFSENEIKIKEAFESSGYGIRVFHDNKIGFAYCEQEKDLGKALDNAKKAARLEIKNFSFVEKSVYKKINIMDRKILEIDETHLKDIIYEIKSGIEKFTKNCRINVEAGNLGLNIKNTSGLDANYEKTGIEIYAEAMLDDGFGHSYLSSVSLPEDFVKIGEEAGEMARAMRGAKKMQSASYTVVFDLEALHSMLSVLLPSFSGDWKRRKISFISDKVNKKIFSDELNIYDDAAASASAIRPFDDEGAPSRRIPLIENGVIKNFLYDHETAALDNYTGNGACSRGDYSTPPSIGNSNLVINSSNGYSNFENELKEFILVKSLHGTHTSNLTTGDFGVEVNAGFHYKDGQANPVRGFIISGNIFNLFNSIEGMEKNSKVFDNLIAPRIAFKDVHVVS